MKKSLTDDVFEVGLHMGSSVACSKWTEVLQRAAEDGNVLSPEELYAEINKELAMLLDLFKEGGLEAVHAYWVESNKNIIR